MPKGKWSDNFIVNLHDPRDSWWGKKIITSCAKDYADWYKVKKMNRFSNRKAEFDQFTELTDGCLNRITVNDKLFIIAHANPQRVGTYGPFELAEALFHWGLRKAGLITFKACEVGKGDFLKQFVRACPAYSIDVGWVKGYNGEAATKRERLFFGKPKESIAVDPGTARVTIVQGNYNLGRDIGRYVDPTKRYALEYEGD